MVAPGGRQDLVVEAVGLTKIFKDFWGRPKARALNGIDLAVKPGQVFGLLGPNGSGKSTTVKLILGLLYPTRGALKVLNESPRNVEMKRRIGYLPEDSYLYRYLTAAETLDFFGALFGLTPEERRRRTGQLLEMVGLANSRNRPVGEFSKGMARRIGLAQALVNDPSLVILDEPTAGLDPIGCREVKDVIRLLASRGKTVILCSHLLADVEDVCDEVVILYGGKIRTQGVLKDILAVQDKTRILTPRLEGPVIEKILDVLGEQVQRQEVAVDQPTMNLEDFFLDVVRRAREASVQTAGAQAGGEIAPYLRGQEDAAEGDLSQKVLEALGGKPDEASEPKPEASDEETGEVKAPAVESAKLTDLAAPSPPPEPAPDEAVAAPAKPDEQPAAVDSASKRLEGLLGQKSQDEKEPNV